MRVALVLLACLAAAAARVADSSRIVGGSVTTVDVYPYSAALLLSWNGGVFWQSCGGSILNIRSVLTAAHCFTYNSEVWEWRIRVGSTWANSGGTVHNTAQIINHPNFDRYYLDNDVAIMRTAPNIVMINNAVQPGAIAGANYNLADNQPVWAIGWGRTSTDGPVSEQLRHVQIWTVNQNVCRQRYNIISMTVTDNMLCAGWLDVGGRDQCDGDSGSPLLHNGVVVGVCSWRTNCALPGYPGVNARVSHFTAWIQNNA